MGRISDTLAIARIYRIKNGGIAKLSISQIVNLLISLFEAMKNLSPQEFAEVYDLFQTMRTCTSKVKMDMNRYLQASIAIIKEFDAIAPYEKYCGRNETEIAELMSHFRGENYAQIRKLKNEIFMLEKALREKNEIYEQNRKILNDAYTDDELMELVEQGDFPADQIERYKEARASLMASVSLSTQSSEALEKMIENKKEELYTLEAL